MIPAAIAKSVLSLDILDDKQKLFVWLYFPYDVNNDVNYIDDTLNAMLPLGKKYLINGNVLFRKTIEYLNIKNYTKEEIIKKLCQYEFLKEHNIDKTNEIIDEVISNKYNDLDTETLQKLIHLTDLYICDGKGKGKCDHSGYPLNHEVHGRPRIGWCVCYFNNCFQDCFTGDALREHLKKFNKYKYGFHAYHEEAIKNYNITPEKVIAENMTKCPSVVCDKGAINFTPQELCEHLISLGIEPFWKKGMPMININKSKGKFQLNEIYEKIYVGDECIICMDEDAKPSVLLLPCNHSCMCVKCYKKTNKCPVCRSDIINAVPI